MSKFHLSFLAVVLFVFAGCTKPSALTNFNYDKFYGKSLQYTSKNDILKNNDVTAMMSATYLNSVDESIHLGKKEVFLIGIFIANNGDKNNKTFKNDYKLTLNEIKPVYMKELPKTDKMYGKMPLYNPWAKYYIVKFNKEKLNKKFLKNLTYKQRYKQFEYKELILKLSENEDSFTSLTFQKEI